MPRRMRPASTRIAALALAASALATAPAAAQTLPTIPGVTLPGATTPVVPQSPDPVPAGAFTASVRGSGHYELRAALTGGGSFTVQSDPAWSASYPRLILPLASVPSLHASPAADGASAGSSSWTLGGSLPGLGAPALSVFSCLGLVKAPALTGAADQPAIDVSGARIQVLLPALPAIAPATSGCTPSQADGRAGWSGELRTWAAGLLITSPQELLRHDVLERAIDVTTTEGAAGRVIGACRVAGTCDQDLRWTGSVTLVKRCRNLAGRALAGGTGAFTCASPCRERSCSLEQARPLAPGGALRLRGRSVRAPVACYGDSVCSGTAELRAAGITLGRSRLRLAPTAAGSVTVRLSAAGARSLRRAGRLRATLTLRLAGSAVRTPARVTVQLRRS